MIDLEFIINIINENKGVVLIVVSNIITYLTTKRYYGYIKSTFYEFTDIVNAIKSAWEDDKLDITEIQTVQKELNDFIRCITLKRGE